MSPRYYRGSPDGLEKRRYSSRERNSPDDEGWVSNEIEARHRVWNAQNGETKDVSTVQEKRKIDSGIMQETSKREGNVVTRHWVKL